MKRAFAGGFLAGAVFWACLVGWLMPDSGMEARAEADRMMEYGQIEKCSMVFVMKVAGDLTPEKADGYLDVLKCGRTFETRTW